MIDDDKLKFGKDMFAHSKDSMTSKRTKARKKRKITKREKRAAKKKRTKEMGLSGR